jgi:adenosylcobinamide kinase / adenosylcobinamide-phosphate guanylyltransferase
VSVEVLLLGTGAADGWPNPFCGCASCGSLRAAGEVRGQTAALVDGTLLLDCGPEAPRAAVRAGRSLADVRHVLLTHGHPDHLAPAALLWRSWAGREEPVEVLGPAAALAACRGWLHPDDPVRLRPVVAGDRLAVGAYTVRVLAAAHDVDAVLYDVASPRGGRLLYATDTGPLTDATLAATAGAGYDLVLLEETFGDVTEHGTGHLDLATFPRVLAALRARGAVADHTDVVAVHLGHRNPPTRELARRLAGWGARVVPDGTALHVPGDRAQERPPGRGAAGPAGPQRTLVLGGARSGKSVEAERTLAAEPCVTYVATARPVTDDPEWEARVAAHRGRRPPGWVTVETRDVAQVLRDADGPVLVDCLSLWLADALERGDHGRRVDELLAAWRQTRARVVAVSNEVGSGVVPATASGREFRDELGRLNARVAAESDEVRLLVAGRVLIL